MYVIAQYETELAARIYTYKSNYVNAPYKIELASRIYTYDELDVC